MPFFTIIATYYQGVTGPEMFERFAESLVTQTFQDFEVLIYHDGPLLHKVNSPYDIFCTRTRQNKWGHDLRGIGLTKAKGKYILHTNADNVYDPHALHNIYNKIQETSANIIITQVEMMGLNRGNGRIWYDKPRDYSKRAILTGNPPVYAGIDLMQVIIAKEIWDKYGWFTFIEQADGIIYTKICSENPYLCTDILIGRHY
jgi:hypothetical protein